MSDPEHVPPLRVLAGIDLTERSRNAFARVGRAGARRRART